MPANSSDTFATKLNQVYRDALARTKIVRRATKKTGWWGDTWTQHHLVKADDFTLLSLLDGTVESLNCCGISEVSFTRMQAEAATRLSDMDFEELVAKYLRHGCSDSARDGRVYICGLPVKRKRKTGSMYDFQFYNRLCNVLLKFGATKVTQRPYTNSNSGNVLWVLMFKMR